MRPAGHKKAVAHPKLNEVEFKFNDHEPLKILSTFNQTEMHVGDWPLDTHPAWTKSNTINLKSTTRFAKFQDKFGDLFEGPSTGDAAS